MKILNIHGYMGSAENSAFSALKATGAEVISPQFDYDKENPDKLLEKLEDMISENSVELITGTSLGGFFSLVLSVRTGLPVILINPCLMPFEIIPRYGYNGSLNEFIRIFGEFANADKDRMYAIIGGDDEIIDSHDFTAKFIPNHEIVPDGKHSGATLNLDERIPRILNNYFCKR